ncbi:MAG: methionyl-tRNA formyltransferase [Peptococcaceae bacterium]|nr:methionyl-tRNA formyltransferase [Peptococcaceae bacterium]
MRIVFMGTPDFAVPALVTLVGSEHEVIGVLCQPDRVAGRGKKERACSVKERSLALGLPVFQPETLKGAEGFLTELAPDCIVVAAYGQILPEGILAAPRYGCVNVHASLLPAYRGAAPIHRAVMNGDRETGVTIMRMDKGLDTGDVLAVERVCIGPEATMGEIHDELAAAGARLLLETLRDLERGVGAAKPQPPEGTYAAKLGADDEKIQWTRPASVIHNQIRGLNPWPGAYTWFRGEKVKIWRSRLVRPEYAQVNDVVLENSESGDAQGCCGRLVGISARGLLCRTGQEEKADAGCVENEAVGEGVLEILEVQPAGKKRMSGRDFYNGRAMETGECFT